MSMFSKLKNRISTDKTARDAVCTEIEEYIKSVDIDADPDKYIIPEFTAPIKSKCDEYEDYPFAEERRLYYVALTRAKKKVFHGCS